MALTMGRPASVLLSSAGVPQTMRCSGMTLFDALGFQWDRSVIPTGLPSHSIERVCFRFHKMLPEFVWDASVLEGNPFTFIEVKTLLDGVTVGGRKVSDQEQVLNLAESSRRLLAMVRGGGYLRTRGGFLFIRCTQRCWYSSAN